MGIPGGKIQRFVVDSTAEPKGGLYRTTLTRPFTGQKLSGVLKESFGRQRGSRFRKDKFEILLRR